MKIGIPKEILSQEYRVSVNPETAKMLLQSSHELFIQSGAGIDSGYSDEDYSALGCIILETASEVFDKSELNALLVINFDKLFSLKLFK